MSNIILDLSCLCNNLRRVGYKGANQEPLNCKTRMLEGLDGV